MQLSANHRASWFMLYLLGILYSRLFLYIYSLLGEKSNRCSDDGGNEDYVQDYDD